jgi:hypothetical protein
MIDSALYERHSILKEDGYPRPFLLVLTAVVDIWNKGNDGVAIAALVPGRLDNQWRQRWDRSLDPFVDRTTVKTFLSSNSTHIIGFESKKSENH